MNATPNWVPSVAELLADLEAFPKWVQATHIGKSSSPAARRWLERAQTRRAKKLAKARKDLR